VPERDFKMGLHRRLPGIFESQVEHGGGGVYDIVEIVAHGRPPELRTAWYHLKIAFRKGQT
jgi:hypothetical protein